jgi:PAS domain-containing protein
MEIGINEFEENENLLIKEVEDLSLLINAMNDEQSEYDAIRCIVEINQKFKEFLDYLDEAKEKIKKLIDGADEELSSSERSNTDVCLTDDYESNSSDI